MSTTPDIIGLVVPEGHRHYTFGERGYLLIIERTGCGAVTIDTGRRTLSPGFYTTHPRLDLPPYRGRGWLQKAVNDAVGHLEKIYGKTTT